jgi:hypothetical protein
MVGVARAQVRIPALAVVLAAIYVLAVIAAVRGLPHPVTLALGFDLTVTATAATWWLAVRPGLLPRRALIAVFAVGALVARLVLAGDASHVAFAAVATLELFVMALAVIRMRRLVRRYRATAGTPLIIRLADALEHIGMPRVVARIATTELVTLPMGLIGWFRRAPRDGFSSHRTHLTLAIHVVLVLLVALETLALHIVIVRASPLWAWISTGSSIYFALWLLGDMQALRLGRVRVSESALTVEIGRRWAVVVPRDAIVAVHRATACPEGAANLALETPTVVVELTAPVTVRGPFGKTRRGAQLALTIDDPDRFIAALTPIRRV